MIRTHGNALRDRYVLTPEQSSVLRRLAACRTELLGGHLDICSDCGHTVPAYNSCRDRHCPKCQSVEQAKWVLKRMERVLPTDHFHTVFTVPSELAPIARANRAAFYALLFSAASETLLDLGRDEARLGGTLGLTCVLHTWTRDLRFHPHVHCIVTGGALSPDGERWIEPRYRGRFLFPVRVLSRLFRGKLLASLERAIARGKITLGPIEGDPALERASWAELRDRLYRKDWIAYAKRPFAGPEQVFRYLGLYTHRVGISNHRLRSMEDGRVSFATKNGATASISGVEFLRRFLLHVLPKRFVKVRHYGLYAAGNVAGKLEQARALLQASGAESAVDGQKQWQDVVDRLTAPGDPHCPSCQVGTMIRFAIDPATGALLPEPHT